MKKLRADQGSSHLDDIAEEILFMILDCLNSRPFDRKAFSLVCKTWYAAESRHRRVLTPLRVDLLPTVLSRYSSVPRLDLSLCPRVSDPCLANVAISLGSSLRSIDLSRSRSFTQAGLEILITNCPSLVEIDLSNATELSDAAAATLGRAKNLEKLSLARCKAVTDIGLGGVATGCPKLRDLSLRWCLGLTDLAIELVAVNCREIRSLDISYVQVTEKCVPQILQLKNLQTLSLEGCHGIDDESLAYIQHDFKSLVSLNLSNSLHVCHLGLSPLIKRAVNLRNLALCHYGTVSSSLTNNFQRFANLRSLQLDGCHFLASGLKALASSFSSLRELSLCKCTGVSDEDLVVISNKNRDLEKLDITCCRKITETSIANITRSCSSLRCLKMESCSLVPREAFVWIGEHCHLLEELDLTDNEVDNEGLKAISRCQRLCILRVGLCLNVNSEGLAHIGMKCQNLREIDLYRSPGITDEGVIAVASSCPLLETINLSYCKEITDESLLSLSQCSNLRTLEIRGCPQISSKGISSIAAGCKQLVKLDVKKCFEIDDSGMIPLACLSQNLREINLSYCSVTDVGLLTLASLSSLRSMTILHVRGLTVSGLATSLLACGALTKVKLHLSFKSLLPKNLIEHVEARGCLVQWRDKPFQMVDSKPIKIWKLRA